MTENIEFSAEISKVLQLMIHSLYTNKDIFLRELVSNASDACDKLRYESLQNDALIEDDADLGITVSFDEAAKSITIEDNGIGMDRDDLIANLGTIAKSGTEEFVKAITGDHKKDVSLIGQFGVGFYSSFMVADTVEVISRKAGKNESWRWFSDGSGAFTVEPAPESERGTKITLKLKDDAHEYLDYYKLEFILQTYSDHISFPIHLISDEGEKKEVNQGAAIWTRPKSEITEEQYQEFYRHVAHSPDKPWAVLHNKAEGVMEYTNLLYIPSMKPFDLFHPERRLRVKLYVKRVFITEENAELVPAYMRFLRGVVDSEDLPLNISRETLQDNPLLGRIREAITKKVLNELIKRGEKDPEGYAEFWDNFGAVLKEGLCESQEPKEKILQACRFASTHDDAKLTSLEAYIERMKPDQKAVYYLIGDDIDTLRNSAQLEGFKKFGVEVLLLSDQVDDFWLSATPKYKEFEFRSVQRHGSDLDAFTGEQEKSEDEASESKEDKAASKADIDTLIAHLKEIYGQEIRDVRTTHKLAESPACLAISEGDMDMRMERFLLEHKQLPKASTKILEINPDHAIISYMAAQPKDEIAETAWILLDQARIQEGEPLRDPALFNQRIYGLMAKALKVGS
ncbi:MAG: molecular chaperone HtpG [Rickettsiales bacterium]|nr:molecular chaperone HtpG [Rickettsiales bacterium]